MRENSRGIGGHQSAKAKSVEYFTPPEIVRSLGQFDLDPCFPVEGLPWQTAKKCYTKEDNGLILPWEGRVWLNPPYGKELAVWCQKMSLHNNGVLLCFNRSETDCMHEYVYPFATSHFIMRGRLHFYKHILDASFKNGVKETIRIKDNAGGPTVLFAYGEENSDALDRCGLPGRHFPLNSIPVFIFGFQAESESNTLGEGYSWRSVISLAITKLNGRAEVSAIYEKVKELAPGKTENNVHYKEKIRQRLQTYFIRVDRGIYANNNN